MKVSRTTNQKTLRTLTNNIHDQLQKQQRIFAEVSANKKILKPSDDPVGASQVLRLKKESARLFTYQRIGKEGQTWAHVTGSAIDNAVSTWKRVSEIAISAADSTKSEYDRHGMAEEVDQLLQHFVQVANTSHSGQYIFGGGQTQNMPFSIQTDPHTNRITSVYYQGDNQLKLVKSQLNNTVSVNALGSNAGDPNQQGTFIDSNAQIDTFKTLISLRDKLYQNDIIGISNQGGLIEQVELSAKNLISAQVRIGGNEEALNLDINRSGEQNSEVDALLNDVEMVDTAKRILELNDYQNTYEASLAIGGRIQQKSLLNFI
ncbi:MAG: flagellar hook-associated protein 3 [Chlamydiales bacterium]|jgi:flagellar hook-associated protein 3 FlgL|nr:flagellar hook-associated protein 3 [Chlamydiales bacterium]